ncbi:hypothetical protein [Winogradskya humida]|uniref:Formiminotetrahydrofolate cyclodeaminase n=1 Tax=Winogradskya humida TaxID=113566 RepID=A0ABQ3ZGI1_9ACTN|nr:hypothetical protein [Actinoplanes humidus]GIE17652.1 hypothetical protein Ahu01nite_007540 [Actinoplanes humidus]
MEPKNLPDRLTDLVARAVNGGAIAPGVVAACQIGAIGLDVPPEVGLAVGTVIGAAIGSASEEMVDVMVRMHLTKIERVATFNEEFEAAGLYLDEVISEAVENPDRLDVLAGMIATAASSRNADKIKLLARAYIANAYSDDNLDNLAILRGALQEIEGPHLRLMSVIVANPNLEESALLAANPLIASSFHVLVGRLQSIGFARPRSPQYSDGVLSVDDEPVWALTRSGEEAMSYLGSGAAD